MNYKLKNGDKISSASIATINVTKANTDLNDYTENGTYYFPANVTPTNIPGEVNGWLEVLTGIQAGTKTIKQIWHRHGTNDSSDYEIFVRTCADGASWSKWNRIETLLQTIRTADSTCMKYSDGTLICSGTISKTINITSNYEGVFFNSISNINFPISFSTTPQITATVEQQSALLGVTIMRATTNGFEAYIWKNQSKSDVPVKLHYQAIGRWK